MSRICQITGKHRSVGNNRSFAMKASKRVFEANIFKKKVFDPKTGKMTKMRISTRALRTLSKNGI
jgi:large subunit ribosomal protein L28